MPSNPAADWAASLPPPPFVDPTAGPGESRFVPLSPRVAVLIVAAIVLGVVLWMARDSVRPFIVGLLFVYLLDPPVRWLARRGVRRSIAILIVYVVAIVAFVEFLAFTLTPLVNEILRFIADFPKPSRRTSTSSSSDSASSTRASRSQSAIRDWIDSVIAGIGEGGAGGGRTRSDLPHAAPDRAPAACSGWCSAT